MGVRAVVSPLDEPWQASAAEAVLLANLLRASRLTCLIGAAGAGKTSLLTQGVLPLLRRRASDRPAAAGLVPAERVSGVVVPFPDRRQRSLLAERRAEVPVFFDAWHANSQRALRARIHAALGLVDDASLPVPLAPLLAALHARHRVRFLFVFDGFEELLEAATRQAEAQAFVDEWVRAVNQPLLPANFLLGADDRAQPLLAALRAQVPGLEDQIVRLSRESGETRLRQPAAAAAQAPSSASEPGTDNFSLSLDAMLARVARVAGQEARERADETAAEPEAPSAAAATPGRLLAPQSSAPSTAPPTPTTPSTPPMARPGGAARHARATVQAGAARAAHVENAPVSTIATAMAMAAEVVSPQQPAPQPAAARAGRVWPRAGWLAPPLAAAVLAFWLWPRGEAPEPAAAPRIAAVPAPAAPPVLAVPAPTPKPAPLPVLARFGIGSDAESGTDRQMAEELARGVAAAGVALVPTGAPAGTSPRLEIVRYDALQAAGSALDIVMPMHTEEIYFIVRADSPLKFIHELQGRRINMGPAGGARAASATGVYRRMFGTGLPASPAGALDKHAALQRLLAGRDLDVMVVVDAQPASWLAGLPPDEARGIRLLALDASRPASRKALQAYLPATVRATHYRNTLAQDLPTLGVMSFLVAPQADGEGAPAADLGVLGRAVCAALPGLQRAGHPKWAEVKPALQLPAGPPYAPAAAAALQACV
jgi:hypothetical protein